MRAYAMRRYIVIMEIASGVRRGGLTPLAKNLNDLFYQFLL
jgi:hypothetical protein